MRAALLVAAGFLTLAGAAPAGNAPVVVAVVDSGVDGPVPGLVPGWNAVDGSSDTRDTGGHGTGVAFVAAATCGGCRILPVRITDDSGSSTQGLIASGIRWAAGHGARVINLSWGLAIGGRSTGQVERAIASAVGQGAVVTPAAMNDGSRDPNLNPWASRSPDAVRVARSMRPDGCSRRRIGASGSTSARGDRRPRARHHEWPARPPSSSLRIPS